MSKLEILDELPRLTVAERAEVQAKLDELSGESWHDHAELSDEDKSLLDTAIAGVSTDPLAESPWDDAKARIEKKLRA